MKKYEGTLEFKTVAASGLDQENMAQDEDKFGLFDIARKRGIVLPSPHLAIFKTVYAKIEEANLNGVRLARQAVLDALPTLIGKQVNLNHFRKGFIVGHIIDAELNLDDQIEATFVYYKDIYIEDFDRSIAQFQRGDLTVSFELNANSDFVEELEDGTVRLHEINFAGMGLLLDDEPAYPAAVVFEMAKKIKDRLASIDNTTGMVFASEIKKTCDTFLTIARIEGMQDDVEQGRHVYFTTTDNGSTFDDHFHAVSVDMQGNGKTVSIRGKDQGFHEHEVIRWEVQPGEADGHPHDLLVVRRAIQELEKNKNTNLNEQEKSSSEDKSKDKKQKGSEEKNEGGNKMSKPTVEEIKKLKTELGDLCKEWTDEDFANEDKIKEARDIIKQVESDLSNEDESAEKENSEEAEESDEKADEGSEEAEESNEEEAEEEEATDEDESEEEDEAEENEEAEDNSEEGAESEESSEESESDSKEENSEEADDEGKDEDPKYDVLEKENKDLKSRVKELEDALEAKSKEYDMLQKDIPQIKEDAIKVESLKKELDGFTVDFTDVDFLNPMKVKMARLEKENTELKKEKDEKVKVANKDKPDVDTGHDADDENKDEDDNPASVLIDAKANKLSAKQYKKADDKKK